MEFKELIQVRRSVRAYSAPPSREDLEQILKEAQQAPSWKNSQTTRWYVAETPEKREEVRQALHAANQKKAVNAALIVSTYVRDIAGFTNGNPDNEVGNGWGAYDLGLHDAYLLLAAKNAGFDSPRWFMLTAFSMNFSGVPSWILTPIAGWLMRILSAASNIR